MAVKEKEETNVSAEREKALKLAIEKIEKDFGKGSIMNLATKQPLMLKLFQQVL